MTAAVGNLTANSTSPSPLPEVRIVTTLDNSGFLQVIDASAVFAAPNSTVEDKGIGGKLKGLFGGKEDGKKDNATEVVDSKEEEKNKDIVKKLVVNYKYGPGRLLTREEKWASQAKSVSFSSCLIYVTGPC